MAKQLSSNLLDCSFKAVIPIQNIPPITEINSSAGSDSRVLPNVNFPTTELIDSCEKTMNQLGFSKQELSIIEDSQMFTSENDKFHPMNVWNQSNVYCRGDILNLQSSNIPINWDIPNMIILIPPNLFYYLPQSPSHPLPPLSPLATFEVKPTLIETFLGILNKIDASSYEEYSKAAFDLVSTAQSKEEFESISSYILEKSINEPAHSQLLARLCSDMSKLFIFPNTPFPSSDTTCPSSKRIVFRKCVLEVCKRETEKERCNNDILIKMKSEIESCDNSIERQSLASEYALKESEMHKHFYGNFIFIGELYKLKFISENIIFECINTLLKGRPSDCDLEAFYKLYTVIGESIDKPENKERMDQYFIRIQRLMNRGFMSARINALLMELITLRMERCSKKI